MKRSTTAIEAVGSPEINLLGAMLDTEADGIVGRLLLDREAFPGWGDGHRRLRGAQWEPRRGRFQLETVVRVGEAAVGAHPDTAVELSPKLALLGLLRTPVAARWGIVGTRLVAKSRV
jgi:hypothetical protein